LGNAEEHTETLTIAFESDSNRADAQAVAMSLEALNALIKAVQGGFPDNEQLLVKARPFNRGSLELPIDLIVVGSAMLMEWHPLLKRIIDVLSQYLEIKKALKGSPPEIKEGNVILVDAERIDVDNLTMQFLSAGSPVDERFSEAFSCIEDDSEIKGVKISSESRTKPLSHVCRAEFPYFYSGKPTALEDLGERYEENKAKLIVRQPAFDRELKWRFFWQHLKIAARIEDTTFLRNVVAGKESFTSGDVLTVTLRCIKQYDTGEESYAITKVWDHEHPERHDQNALFE